MPASPATEVPLPPLAPWHGASEKLLENVPAEWRTPAEASGFATTPGYADTLAFLERLDRASPLISIHEFGRSSEGRPLVVVIASRDTERDFAALRRSPRARVLAQGGIHSGEIDGKDAGLMLLRDIVSGRRADVLDKATLLFVPVYNPDAYSSLILKLKLQTPILHPLHRRGNGSLGAASLVHQFHTSREESASATPS